MKVYDLVVIGGGPAGLFAVTQAKKRGIENILLIERKKELGGMLNQCIHSGFGTGEFDKELTGTEFAHRMIMKIKGLNIEHKTDTTVYSISKDRKISMVNHKDGIQVVEAKAIILATGAMERPRGSMNILGSSMSGIFTAGSVQRFINEQGVLPGKNVVILGSRDMGMVVARQLKIEGANVIGVYEFKDHVGGTKKVYERCIKDFNIDINFNQTIISVHGNERINGVYVAEVDNENRFIEETQKFIPCDTLVLSVGLEPIHDLPKRLCMEMNEETKSPLINSFYETSIQGVFTCGNALHVHDYIDHIRDEAKDCVKSVASYLNTQQDESFEVSLEHDENIKFCIPNKLKIQKGLSINKHVYIKLKIKKRTRNVAVNIHVGDKLIYRETMNECTPSETKWIKLSQAQFDDCDMNSQIKVSIEKMTMEG